LLSSYGTIYHQRNVGQADGRTNDLKQKTSHYQYIRILKCVNYVGLAVG